MVSAVSDEAGARRLQCTGAPMYRSTNVQKPQCTRANSKIVSPKMLTPKPLPPPRPPPPPPHQLPLFFFFFFFFGRSHCLLPLLLCRAVALRPNPLLRLTFRRSSALSPLDCRVGFTIAWRSESQGGPGQLKRRRARTHRKTSLVELRSRRSFLLLFLTRRGQAARDAVTREIERAFKPILC
jgi:hypothetical protein